MRILHVITSLRTGGAERLVTDLALRHGEDEVGVLLFDGTRTPLTEELEKGGVTVHSLGKGPRAMRNPLLLLRLARFLRKHPCDIVHTHNTSCQFLAALAHGHAALVTTEHNTSNRRRNWRWFRPVDRWMYGRYSRIICVGEETRQTLSAWLSRPELDAKMVVIPNGIDLHRIAGAAPAADLATGPGDASHKILMVSAFRPEKDQQTLIRAVKLLPETYRLFLAGGAETAESRRLLDACRALASSLGIADRVRFLGRRTDVPSLLAAADAIVLSSYHEGMSLSVLEGMASGRPMIASDVEGMRELVKDAGLLFPPGNAENLASLLRQVCENPEVAREIGRKCREKAQRYDIAETALRYDYIYKNAVGGG